MMFKLIINVEMTMKASLLLREILKPEEVDESRHKVPIKKTAWLTICGGWLRAILLFSLGPSVHIILAWRMQWQRLDHMNY